MNMDTMTLQILSLLAELGPLPILLGPMAIPYFFLLLLLLSSFLLLNRRDGNGLDLFSLLFIHCLHISLWPAWESCWRQGSYLHISNYLVLPLYSWRHHSSFLPKM